MKSSGSASRRTSQVRVDSTSDFLHLNLIVLC